MNKEILFNIENGKNIFITGGAGTGKSYLLSQLQEHYQQIFDFQITASTGIAAVQVSGITVHSWACLGAGNRRTQDIINYVRSGPGTQARRKLRNVDILAIDEVSMITPEVFSQLDEVLKNIRENDRPFGGLQLVLVGDFFQLPPVNRDRGDEDLEFCFETESWKNAEIKVVELTHNHRQNDAIFLKLLANLRKCELDSQDVEMLNHRVKRPELEDDIQPTIVVTHNYQAQNINKNCLAQIDLRAKKYLILAEGHERSVEFLMKNCLAPHELRLKVGAQVMMLKNSYQKEGIYNGSLGVVVDFSKDFPLVKFNNGKIIKIMPDEWTMEKFNEETAEMEVKARLKQLPLNLAWAITVHKSQGMTLDKIDCDLSKAFTEGQIYVTISRVRSLEGLYVRGINYDSLKSNPKVVDFYNNVAQNE